MEWKNVQRKLADLDPWESNPRFIEEDQAQRLAQSFDEFGQVETIAIGPDNEVYNGHQRLNVLMVNEGPDYVVECRQSSEALTEKQRQKLTAFLHKGTTGKWDWDMLGNEWDPDEMLEWGFEEFELGMGGMKAPEFEEFTEDETFEEDEKEIECPNCGHIFYE